MDGIKDAKSTWIVLSCVVGIFSLKVKGNQGLRRSPEIEISRQEEYKKGKRALCSNFSHLKSLEGEVFQWRERRKNGKEEER